ncbi:MAG: hypothetical protein LN561_01535 [Rickettsia endosymbiont of Labidopullus appendiculatus]|nr:hypothetical protein [Rickettsia endosymbiont of Labidopullus appendiculatus]
MFTNTKFINLRFPSTVEPLNVSSEPEASSTKLIRHSEYTALLVGKTWAKPFASVTLAGVIATLLINPRLFSE